jgi:hypothetical protein
MKFKRWLFLPILAVLTSTSQAGAVTNIITRTNQAELNCTVTVDVRTNAAQNGYTFTISIPKDDPRLKRLFRAAFVLGSTNLTYQNQPLDVPAEIKTNVNGSMQIIIGVGKDQLKDSFVRFECFWENPRLSSLDVVFLDLKSYTVKEK